MVVRGIAAGLLAVLCCAPAGAQTTIPLLMFEAEIARSPAVAIARDAADLQRADVAIERGTRGPRILGNAQLGAYREQVTNTLERDYGGLSGQVTLREPILGEAATNRDAVLRAQIVVAARDGDVEIARRTVLRAVRQAYIAYWNAARRGALAEDFANGAGEVSRALDLRMRAHLLLRADELDFGSQYAAARRDATRSARDAIRARGSIGVALGREVAPFAPTTPVFDRLCASADAAYAPALAHSPTLVALQAEADTERRLATSSAAPVTAGIDVTQSLGLQSPATGPGSGTSVGVDFSLPLGEGGLLADQRRRDRLQAEATELRIAQVRAQLRVDVDDAWAGILQTTDDLRFEQARADAGSEAVREAELRYGRVPGDTLEQLLQARYVYYGEAADRLDAEAALLIAQTELAFLTGDRCGAGDASPPIAVVSSAASAAPRLPAVSVYAWDAGALLDAAVPDDAWAHLADEGIVRVFLGLDARRVAAAATSEGTARVNDELAIAARHGIEVDLLLGDPQWINAGDRGQLFAIVRSLRGIAFGGLELDLEPGALVAQGESHGTVVRDLADTVAETARVSPWPVGISVSYRELAGNPCFACLLRGVKLREVTLMTYVANPERAAELTRPILLANPALRFAIAESVEPGLGAGESYAGRGRAAFVAATVQLDAALRGTPNYAGIRVQALADLEALAR